VIDWVLGKRCAIHPPPSSSSFFFKKKKIIDKIWNDFVDLINNKLSRNNEIWEEENNSNLNREIKRKKKKKNL
jgi:hypothetical protein